MQTVEWISLKDSYADFATAFLERGKPFFRLYLLRRLALFSKDEGFIAYMTSNSAVLVVHMAVKYLRVCYGIFLFIIDDSPENGPIARPNLFISSSRGSPAFKQIDKNAHVRWFLPPWTGDEVYEFTTLCN